MAKKQVKGFENKGKAKVIATAVAGGVLAIGIAGGSIIAHLNRRPEAEHPYKEDITTGSLVKEPELETEPGYTDNYQPEQILPELQEPIIPDNNDKVEQMDVEFTEVLAKLTSMSNEYISQMTGGTSNLTITGFTSMNINLNSGEIAILGQSAMGDRFNNFVATIQNYNPNLEIYNLPAGEIPQNTFIRAFNKALDDEESSFKIQLKQYMQLSNQTEVIEDMLQNRLNQLALLDSTDETVKAEIAHIKSLDIDDLDLSVLLISRTTAESGYNYSFTTVINTGKYVYSANHILNSKKTLTSSAIKLAIENYLDTNIEYNVSSESSSAVNNTIYIINENAFNMQEQNTLSK